MIFSNKGFLFVIFLVFRDSINKQQLCERRLEKGEQRNYPNVIRSQE